MKTTTVRTAVAAGAVAAACIAGGIAAASAGTMLPRRPRSRSAWARRAVDDDNDGSDAQALDVDQPDADDVADDRRGPPTTRTRTTGRGLRRLRHRRRQRRQATTATSRATTPTTPATTTTATTRDDGRQATTPTTPAPTTTATTRTRTSRRPHRRLRHRRRQRRQGRGPRRLRARRRRWWERRLRRSRSMARRTEAPATLPPAGGFAVDVRSRGHHCGRSAWGRCCPRGDLRRPRAEGVRLPHRPWRGRPRGVDQRGLPQGVPSRSRPSPAAGTGCAPWCSRWPTPAWSTTSAGAGTRGPSTTYHVEDDPRTRESAETQALSRLGHQELLDLLELLPDDQRSVVLLRVVGDLSIRQTAAAMGRAESAVVRMQSKGLATLRQLLSTRPDVQVTAQGASDRT